ncbi:MAG TPA: type IX secretion system outer membrane channel protein PorV [Mucilaginibacter sp.]|jgi:hypothetical protein
MKFFSVKTVIFFSSILLPSLAISQTTGTNTNGSNLSAIPTAVPFLNITPDSRSGAMGDAGVAISPDANANYWNPAKLAYLENDNDFSLSYSPWLRQLVPDISLSFLSYAHKLDDRNTLGVALRYFNYGTIQLTDNNQNNQGSYSPSEFSLNGSFARKFGDELSLGLTFGYIHSNLSNTYFATGTGVQAKAGNSISAGVSLFYTKKMQEFGNDAIFSFGTNISNIGSKISYSTDGPKYFLPANLKIGVANTLNLDDYNQLTFALDFNKLLVPTPPITDQNGNIIKGQSDNVSVPAGIFASFTDAPGGFSEELQEITISPGLEYWYNRLFALRAGYFYQNPNKGGAHYLTLGAGFKYDIFDFDFSYLAASQQNSPLSNTLRFSLIATFGGNKNSNKK